MGHGFLPLGDLHRVNVEILSDFLDGFHALDRFKRHELFFRWIKGHLRIKHYYGMSPNAVKTQIWIAVCICLMIAILHKQPKLSGTLLVNF